jgi:hypothetical protein
MTSRVVAGALLNSYPANLAAIDPIARRCWKTLPFSRQNASGLFLQRLLKAFRSQATLQRRAPVQAHKGRCRNFEMLHGFILKPVPI